MSDRPFLNLMVYSDSLAFRRLSDSHDMAITYPFALARLIEEKLGIRVNLIMRGAGAACAPVVRETLERDTGYFGGDSAVTNIAVLQFGIVDCAPRPVTYKLAPLLTRIPVVGPRVLGWLVKYRPGIQTLMHYRLTSPRRFRREYHRMLRLCNVAQIMPVAVGMPLPPMTIEKRSPGFRRSVETYNEMIREITGERCCDIEESMTEEMRDTHLQSDGHHLTAEGHRLYAERLFDHIARHMPAAETSGPISEAQRA